MKYCWSKIINEIDEDQEVGIFENDVKYIEKYSGEACCNAGVEKKREEHF